MATYTSNGCSKAVRKGYAYSNFRTKPGFVATIDFGTTHCSVAYTLRPGDLLDPSKVDPMILVFDGPDRNKREPSCILFDMNGHMVTFGSEARRQYTDLDKELKLQFHYFEHVKRELHHEKVLVCLSWFGYISI